ncbi:hypothetical protein [Aeromicrobium sp. HA]|uniref:hypothetical protein n=1 Tax=Aeromicrobium sp. HA TaxID=3009077 RepID=UPI0022AF2AF5|nr:hypothetical protein [Aeromicrobium sp. HA]
MSTTPKQPTDHKGTGVKFKSGAKTYTLPPVEESVVEKVPGKFTYDVTMNPDSDEAQIRLAFAYLDVMGKPAMRDALLELPTGEMMTVLGRWFLGESEGSSE